MMNTTTSNEQIGNYKILSKLGEGGMAYIYKALQPALNRTVVLKKLKDPNREIIARFKQEALLSASFNQENLAAIYDFLYVGKSYYLIMEYIDGEDLRTIIDNMAPLTPTVGALVTLGIARGLEYTHLRNIIHRDIKPSNILVSYSGDVKLIDFGVAKDDVSAPLTLTGMIVGTPAYMSPEQANGEALSACSDLFSLGILLYEMMTGVKPFYGGNSTEILAKILQHKYIPPERINPEIPIPLRRIIKKALARDITQRYQSAGEFVHDLEKFLPWQTRSHKKEVLSRFMEKVKSNGFTGTDEHVRLQQLMGLKIWPWRLLKSTLVLVSLYLLIYSGWYFFSSQVGYAQLMLSEKAYSIQVGDAKSFTRKGSSTLIGPLLRGIHKLKIRDLETGSINISRLNIRSGDTVRFEPLFQKRPIPARLTVYTNPLNASISIDNRAVEPTALDTMTFLPRTYTVSIDQAGYKTLQERIEVRAGENYVLQVQLDRQ